MTLRTMLTSKLLIVKSQPSQEQSGMQDLYETINARRIPSRRHYGSSKPTTSLSAQGRLGVVAWNGIRRADEAVVPALRFLTVNFGNRADEACWLFKLGSAV